MCIIAGFVNFAQSFVYFVVKKSLIQKVLELQRAQRKHKGRKAKQHVEPIYAFWRSF